MSFFNSVKSMLQPPSQASPSITFITGVDSYGELPQGFFRVQSASGKESLGYNGSFLCWDCGNTVVDGKRITLAVPRESLPVVRLNFSKRTEGVQQVGSGTIIETDSLEPDNGAVVWDDLKPSDGVGWR
jgi:hypothetical protein